MKTSKIKKEWEKIMEIESIIQSINFSEQNIPQSLRLGQTYYYYSQETDGEEKLCVHGKIHQRNKMQTS